MAWATEEGGQMADSFMRCAIDVHVLSSNHKPAYALMRGNLRKIDPFFQHYSAFWRKARPAEGLSQENRSCHSTSYYRSTTSCRDALNLLLWAQGEAEDLLHHRMQHPRC
ncbi:unnamed protein product [Cercospora beticola]|nr:unnamed protein product [Cercospora beticola]